MICYFCNNSAHVSEYCPNFQTLRQRNFLIQKKKKRNCLCDNPTPEKSNVCHCLIVCPACFQHHHIAMCPKRDPEHRLNPILIPEPLCLFSHHSPFAKRFFELCNPIDQFKLQGSCKYFKNLQPVSLKLDYRYSKKHWYPNIVFNGIARFHSVYQFATLQTKTKSYFNFYRISLHNCSLNEADLKFLAKSDPSSVTFNSCVFDDNVSLQEILNAFPYATEFNYFNQSLSSAWILNILCSDRKVDFQKIEVETNNPDFELEDLVNLFEQNKTLALIITVKGRNYLADIPIISTVINSKELFACKIECGDLCFRTPNGHATILLDYIRSFDFTDLSI